MTMTTVADSAKATAAGPAHNLLISPTQERPGSQLVTVADWKLDVQRNALASDPAALLAAIENAADEEEEDVDDDDDDVLEADMSDLAEGSFESAEDQERHPMSVAMKPTLDVNGEVQILEK